MVALSVGEAEEPFLQDRIFTVPQRECEAEQLLVVANPGEAILAPAVRARARLIMGERRPSVAARAVVLADRPPLPFAEVRPPASPRHALLVRLPQPILLHRHYCTPLAGPLAPTC